MVVVAAAAAVMASVVVVIVVVVSLVVVVVVVIPGVDSVAVFVAPFNFGCKMGPMFLFVSLNCVLRVSSPIAIVVGIWLWNINIPVILGAEEICC